MSTAQRLKAEGKDEGVWIGRLLTLEKFMGLPESDPRELNKLDAAALEVRYASLEQQYNERFKR